MKLPRSLWKRGLLFFFALLLLIQAVPYGRDHENPPLSIGPKWDSPRTAELAWRFCYDCHSNESTWPWYSNIAPISWLVQYDVEEGREHLNFSEMDRGQRNAHEAAEEVDERHMPPWQYTIGRSDRQMTDEERKDLIAGLRATFGADDHDEPEGHDDEGHEDNEEDADDD